MTVRVIALLILVLLVSTACFRPVRELEVDEVLPAGYSEQLAPEFFEDAFGDIAYAPGVWTRCFDCDLDWQGLQDHLRLNPNMLGYTNTTETCIKIWATPDVPEDFMRDFVRAYSSPAGTYHVFAFNLKFIRDKGVLVGSGGDFIITCGPDWLDNYK